MEAVVNITFSIFNNILSIKCWQLTQGPLECFEMALDDEIIKLAVINVVERTWAIGTERHQFRSGPVIY